MQEDINILVVEDDKKTAQLLESTLQPLGYRIWLAHDPKEGLELMRSKVFPVVITELHCAKMSGTQFIREAIKINPATNIIVATLYSLITPAIEAMEAGAYGYITKPLHSSEIRIVAERAVERFILLSARDDKEYFIDLAVCDGLTGLFNRRYFNELIAMEFNRIKRVPATFSLLMLDIDNFKNYNDTQGHQAGDVLLKDAAKVFKKSARTVDVVCRYGGEEFVIVLPHTDKVGAQVIAQRLCAQAGIYLPTTVSIGVATVPDDAGEANQLIAKADSALYQAKKNGKNTFCAA